MRPRRHYSLQQLFQMFAVFGVDLATRWGEAKTIEQATELWETAKTEAKESYRSMAMELHPDRNVAPEAGEQMAEVNQLWSIIEGLKPTFRVRPPEPPPPENYNAMIAELMGQMQRLQEATMRDVFRDATVVNIHVHPPQSPQTGTTDTHTRTSTQDWPRYRPFPEDET